MLGVQIKRVMNSIQIRLRVRPNTAVYVTFALTVY